MDDDRGPDNVVWLHLGSDPQVKALEHDVLEALELEDRRFRHAVLRLVPPA